MAMTCMCYAGQKPLCDIFPVPGDLACTDLLSVLHLSHIASQVPQRQAVAVYPAGTVIDFALRQGGATAWWHVVEGGMVGLMVNTTRRMFRHLRCFKGDWYGAHAGLDSRRFACKTTKPCMS